VLGRLVLGGVRDRNARRGLAVLWDLATFWPRWFHPLAQRSYSDTAVTELSELLRRRAANGDATVLAPHSQGSVIAAAAILHAEQAGADLSTLGLVTYGSPLGRLYRELFPGMFPPTVLDAVASATAAAPAGEPRWRNLWRVSDPIGGAIWRAGDGSPYAAEVDGPSLPDGLPDAWVPPRSHSNYWSEPAYKTAMVWLWEQLLPGAPPPADPEPPVMPPTGPVPAPPQDGGTPPAPGSDVPGALGRFDGYTETPVTVDTRTFPVLRRGDGPRVVVLHELPGATPALQGFADRLVDEGFQVHVPLLYGRRGGVGIGRGFVKAWCLRRELVLFTTGRTGQLATWLGGLLDQLTAHDGGPAAVVGMCMTGGLVLTTMVHPSVTGVVASQPSLPLGLGLSPHHVRASFGLSDADRAAAAATDTPLLCLRFRDDWRCSDERVDAIEETFASGTGEHAREGGLTISSYGALTLIQADGKDHSVLTADRIEAAVTYAVGFLAAGFAGDGQA
jgi:dienelactone hydrolase